MYLHEIAELFASTVIKSVWDSFIIIIYFYNTLHLQHQHRGPDSREINWSQKMHSQMCISASF